MGRKDKQREKSWGPTEPEPHYVTALRAWARVLEPYYRRARVRRCLRRVFLGRWPDLLGNLVGAVLYVLLFRALARALSLYVPWIPW